MRHFTVKLAMLSALAFALSVTFSFGHQSQPQASPAQDQAQQQGQPPPHVDVEPDPASRQLERAIQDEFAKDPHSAYARVTVHVTDTEIILGGVVLTATARDQAVKIATDRAAGRKVTSLIKINKNIHPA
jgi:osmotically-inducible protein OsmY